MSSVSAVVAERRGLPAWGRCAQEHQISNATTVPGPFFIPLRFVGLFSSKVLARPSLHIQAPEDHKTLSSAQLRKQQIAEAERLSGLTLQQMGELQMQYMQAKADLVGKPIGEYLLDLAGRLGNSGGYGHEATWWPSLSESQKASWQRRYEVIERRLMQEAPAPIRQLLKEARATGQDKGIHFDPALCEKYEAYALCSGSKLSVGKVFLEDAEANLARVYNNVAHELGGHWRYGPTVSYELFNHGFGQLSEEQRAVATSGRSLYKIFHYPETEIYAELCELDWRVSTTSTDEPKKDIPAQLRTIQKVFEPTVARALVLALRSRAQRDSRISPAARKLLDESIKSVFGRGFLR